MPMGARGDSHHEMTIRIRAGILGGGLDTYNTCAVGNRRPPKYILSVGTVDEAPGP